MKVYCLIIGYHNEGEALLGIYLDKEKAIEDGKKEAKKYEGLYKTEYIDDKYIKVYDKNSPKEIGSISISDESVWITNGTNQDYVIEEWEVK